MSQSFVCERDYQRGGQLTERLLTPLPENIILFFVGKFATPYYIIYLFFGIKDTTTITR